MRQNSLTAKIHKGGCTAAILKVDGPNTMSTAVVGDSGYSLFRVNSAGEVKLYFRSKEGQSQFNVSYQVSHEDEDLDGMFGEQTHTDM